MAYNPNKELKSKLLKVSKYYSTKRTKERGKGRSIPERLTVKDILNQATSEQDVLYYIDYMQAYTKRGSGKIPVVDNRAQLKRYEIERLELARQRTRVKLEERLKYAMDNPQKIYGKKLDKSNFIINVDEVEALKSKIEKTEKSYSDLTQSEILNYQIWLQSEFERQTSGIKTFKESVLYQLGIVYETLGMDKKFDTVYDKLNQLSPDQFIDLYYNESGVKDLLENYDATFVVSKSGKTSRTLKDSLQDFERIAESFYEGIDTIIADYV